MKKMTEKRFNKVKYGVEYIYVPHTFSKHISISMIKEIKMIQD